jgi:hypothetical protein
MKENIGKVLSAYQEHIVQSADAEQGAEDREMRALIENASRYLVTYEDTQARMYNLQKEKAKLMDLLHEKFRAIEADEAVFVGEEDEGVMVYGAEDGTYEAVMGNRSVPVSKGELCTDGEWGIDYALDPATTSRTMRKRHILEDTKRKLRSLLDTQLLENEAGAKFGNTKFFRDMLDGKVEQGMGNVAEKMVRAFLRRVSIDFPVDFTVVEADVVQDTKETIDFIIHRKSHARGARVSEEEREDVGIQFTTDTRPETINHKTKQVEGARGRARESGEVDDVVLVAIPLLVTRSLYEAWQCNPQPGGPEKLWDEDIKEQVLRGVLLNIVPDDEIQDTVDRVCSTVS